RGVAARVRGGGGGGGAATRCSRECTGGWAPSRDVGPVRQVVPRRDGGAGIQSRRGARLLRSRNPQGAGGDRRGCERRGVTQRGPCAQTLRGGTERPSSDDPPA